MPRTLYSTVTLPSALEVTVVVTDTVSSPDEDAAEGAQTVTQSVAVIAFSILVLLVKYASLEVALSASRRVTRSFSVMVKVSVLLLSQATSMNAKAATSATVSNMQKIFFITLLGRAVARTSIRRRERRHSGGMLARQK